MKQEKIQDLMALLQKGLESIQNEESYKNYLKVMSRFPRYSQRNTMLIFAQKPDATLVAGYRTWQKSFGRQVRKGEKGIRIFAPCTYAKQESDPETLETKTRTIHSFRSVCVFDYSQTEGKELPAPRQPVLLSGACPWFDQAVQALSALTGYSVEIADSGDGSRGSCSYFEHRILISASLESLHAFKTLVHETAHVLLHEPGRESSLQEAIELEERSVREVEAESSAFIVCSALGIDCSDYCLPYVTIWNSGRALLSTSLERISKASGLILDALAEKIPEIAASLAGISFPMSPPEEMQNGKNGSVFS